LFQAEQQQHDVTTKLFKESQDKIDELLEKTKSSSKKIDRLEENIERFVLYYHIRLSLLNVIVNAR
jgi:peptidoglycan hydrolase CwlO-like protein